MKKKNSKMKALYKLHKKLKILNCKDKFLSLVFNNKKNKFKIIIGKSLK